MSAFKQTYPPITGIETPTATDLFTGFLFAGINGFGGVMPFARRIIVERRRWLTAEEFIDLLAMCQFLPGPNIVNLAVALGGRFRGPRGALASLGGILLAPMAIVVGCYLLIGSVSDAPAVVGALHGLAAAAAGLVLSMAAKLALPMLRRRDLWAMVVALLAVAGVALLRLPLITVLLVLAPLAIMGERMRRL